MAEIIAPLTGNVWKILVSVGQQFQAGETLVILESMKMEIPVEAEESGTVVEIKTHEGAAVNENAVLLLCQP